MSVAVISAYKNGIQTRIAIYPCRSGEDGFLSRMGCLIRATGSKIRPEETIFIHLRKRGVNHGFPRDCIHWYCDMSVNDVITDMKINA